MSTLITFGTTQFFLLGRFCCEHRVIFPSYGKKIPMLRYGGYCCGYFNPHVRCLLTSMRLGGKQREMFSQGDDLGGLRSGNRSASCIDFYFRGWVLRVPAHQSQLRCHQGQLRRQAITFCFHREIVNVSSGNTGCSWYSESIFSERHQKTFFWVVESNPNPNPYITLSPNTNLDLNRKPNPLTLTHLTLSVTLTPTLCSCRERAARQAPEIV